MNCIDLSLSRKTVILNRRLYLELEAFFKVTACTLKKRRVSLNNKVGS